MAAYFEGLLGSLEHSQFKLLPLHRFGSAVFHSAFSSCVIPTSEAFPHCASLSLAPLAYVFLRSHASSPQLSSLGYLFAY